jgi:ankyrin repeat protein
MSRRRREPHGGHGNIDIARMRQIALACPRCGGQHTLQECLVSAGAGDAHPNDRFMVGPIDPRFDRTLPDVMWYDTLAYLPANEVVKNVPLVNRYLRNLVWHKWSRPLLFSEMDQGTNGGLGTRFGDKNQTLLVKAIRGGAPLDHIKILIAKGEQVNANGEQTNANTTFIERANHQTALHHAIINKRLDVIKLLLDEGADPNSYYYEQYDVEHLFKMTSIMLAIRTRMYNRPREDIIKTLIASGRVNIDQQDPFGVTNLMYACTAGLPGVVRILLDAGANKMIKDDSDRTVYDLDLFPTISHMLTDDESLEDVLSRPQFMLGDGSATDDSNDD